MTGERLTLDAEDRPSIGVGDVLLVTPDVGRPYRATVEAVEAARDRIRVRIPGDGSAPVPTWPHTAVFYAEELAAWVVEGDLLINPPEPYTGRP